MTGRDLRAVRTALGMEPYILGLLLGVAQSTIYRWETQRSRIILNDSEIVTELLSLLYRHRRRLTQRLGKSLTRAIMEHGVLAAIRELLQEFK